MVQTVTILFLSAAVLSAILTQSVIRIARRKKLYAARNSRTVHTAQVSRIGGIAIFITMVAVSAASVLIDGYGEKIFSSLQLQMLALLIASTLIFIIGLIDDIFGMRAIFKLAAQIAAACIVCVMGIRIETFAQFGIFFGWLSWPLTIIWIVGITNAVNLIDGLDGLSAGIGATACAVIAAFSFYNNQLDMALLMMIMLGSLVGFLFFNFNPAKIFMGDSGSMFLGFFLASSSVICASKVATIMGLLLPALALGLPIFDMFVSIIRRAIQRRSIFSADRGHIHHRLMDRGLQHRNAVIVMYLITLLIAGVGLAMMVMRQQNELLVFVGAILILLGFFRIAGVIKFREMFIQVQENLTRSKAIRKEKKSFESLQNRFRQVENLDQWWMLIQRVAKAMRISELEIGYVSPDGSIEELTFKRTSPADRQNNIFTLDFPIGKSDGCIKSIVIKAPSTDKLETLGRRVALFGRLIDEYAPKS